MGSSGKGAGSSRFRPRWRQLPMARPGTLARFGPKRCQGGTAYGHGVLHGRDAERAFLAGVMRDARAGRAGTLLVHGEPGAGKSALLDDLAANAGSDVCILRTQGVES